MKYPFSQLPFALTARQYAGISLRRVLPWAIFRLGFQPVSVACKHFMPNCEGKFIIVLPPLVYFEMMYLVVENSTNESNNESNRKHENVHVINRNQGTQAFWQKKRKEMRCNPSPTLHQKREIVTMLSVFLDRTRRSFVKCFCGKEILVAFAFFVVKE